MIPLFKVHMPPDVIEPLQKTLLSGYVGEGPRVREFEKKIGDYLGNPHVATVNSCTSGLIVALAALDVGPGDEVITTPMTCAATNMPILNRNAKIVWADIDPTTGNILASSIKERITPKTKAVCFVHWAGQPAELDEIHEVCRNAQIATIEDAAHALGASYRDKKIGCHGDFVCFSFQAIKHITTGDGGLVAVNGEKSDEILDKVIKIRWYGLDRTIPMSATHWQNDIEHVGYKMHMNDIAATIGLSQLPYLNGIVQRHQENAAFYDEALLEVPNISCLRRTPHAISAAWLYTLLLPSSEDRERFAARMTEAGVACNVVHVRNDNYTIFREFKTSYLPGVSMFCSRMINIPCGWWVGKDEREYIVETIKKIMA